MLKSNERLFLISYLPRHKCDGLNRRRVQVTEDGVQHVGVPQHSLPRRETHHLHLSLKGHDRHLQFFRRRPKIKAKMC